MFCKKCGAPIQSTERFCGNCGAKIESEAEVAETAAENLYETEPQVEEPAVSEPETTPYQQPVYPAASAPSVNTTLWIVLCAIETVLCCSVLPGAIGLVLAIVAATKKENDPAGARSMIKGAKIAFWIGVVLSVLIVILTVLFYVLGTAGLMFMGHGL